MFLFISDLIFFLIYLRKLCQNLEENKPEPQWRDLMSQRRDYEDWLLG
jgi:hypothetical protein